MDRRLLAWARAVKARQPGGPPPLWLFTDATRSPDPLPTIARLPLGLAGIVLRHDGTPGRTTLAREVARLARARRLALVVAGDARLAAAVAAGVHLREGRWPGAARPRLRAGALVTCSAHGHAGLVRARRSGASLAFLSPAFATASHPGAPALGAVRWAALARSARSPVAALGGVSGSAVRRLGPACLAVGAITALDASRVGVSMKPQCFNDAMKPPSKDCGGRAASAISSSGPIVTSDANHETPISVRELEGCSFAG